MHQENEGKIRCSRCRMDQKLCVCAFLRPIDSISLPISMIFHRKEWPKPSNTGHFIAKIFPNVQQIFYHGEGYQGFCEQTRRASQKPILIFPDPDVPILDSGDEQNVKTNGLVFLDGTWNQAQQMLKRSPEIAALPRRRLAPPKREAMLWKEDLDHGMATYEAVAWALSVFSAQEILSPLWQLIRIRTQRVEWLRGIRPEQAVEQGIPSAALETRFIAHN